MTFPNSKSDNQKDKPSQQRLLEGIAHGERAIQEGRTVSHAEAKRRMRRWLK